MSALSNITQRIERSVRLICTTHGACLRMRDLKPPYPLIVGRHRAILHTEDTDESRGIYSEVILFDGYGLSNLARKASLRRIVDIGGNIGAFAVFASLCFPEAEVHAFEPHPVAYSWLEKNVIGRRISIFNQAVADRDGELRFDVKQHATLSSLSDSGSHTVQAISPAKIFPGEEIDFLKMDCEGAEFLIFKDPALLLRTKRLAMEYHLDEVNTFQLLMEYLKAGGHAVSKLTKSSLAPNKFGILWSERTS